jgi:predicted alpha/beta superfamily hydrolase
MSQTPQVTTLIDFQDLGPAQIVWSASYRVRSKIVDQDFLIEIAWPQVRRAEGQTLPVVYVLDGNHAFGLAAFSARAIQGGPFPMPPTLVVGIGYHFEKPEDRQLWGKLRLRDLTPCSDTLYESQAGGAPAPCGGATAFLGFIEEELKPFIQSRFPVDPHDQTLIGSSLGGLFSLHALFTSPMAFQRYVAISPAIYWGDRVLFGLEAALAERTQDLPARLFMAAGGLEEAHDARQKFVSNVYEMDATLRQRAYPSLDVGLHIFEGETHMSVYPGAVTRGLGAVFGGYRDMHDWARWLD